MVSGSVYEEDMESVTQIAFLAFRTLFLANLTFYLSGACTVLLS